jgi:hypothetical protein
MPTPTSPLERSNGILRAFGAPFRLRQHRRSRWVTIYEILPDRRTYLSQISGEQTKAAVLRRLLSNDQTA